jgi:hypothetical protein
MQWSIHVESPECGRPQWGIGVHANVDGCGQGEEGLKNSKILRTSIVING